MYKRTKQQTSENAQQLSAPSATPYKMKWHSNKISSKKKNSNQKESDKDTHKSEYDDYEKETIPTFVFHIFNFIIEDRNNYHRRHLHKWDSSSIQAENLRAEYKVK